MNGSIDLAAIAQALVGALDDGALDELARRVASRHIQPVLLDIRQAATYLGVSPATLRRSTTIQPIHLPDCSKPLYRVRDLDAAIDRAARGGGE
jgi:hypothetical protein